MNHPIAMIPYANMAPFKEMGPPAGCCFIDFTPRASIRALQNKEVWAAAVPVGGLALLGEDVTPIGMYGIAATRACMSVIFFSDQPFERFKYPATLHLTDESASSVRLLYLLMGYQHGFDAIARLASDEHIVNGELHIGDTALRWGWEWESRGRVRGYRYATDLSAQWYRHQGLPFVFARWVIRSDAPPEVHRSLLSWLTAFREKEPALIRKSAPRVAAKLDLPLNYVQRYLEIIRRCLTPEDMRGQTRFSDAFKHHSQGRRFYWPEANCRLFAYGNNA